MKIKNNSEFGKRYYGLHFVEGTAEYLDSDGENYKVFVGELAMREMDKTFDGKPLVVNHRDEVNPEDQDFDGVVVKSFYNPADGKHWAEFLATTDDANQKILDGWKLSNCYVINEGGTGGTWHGMEYAKEVISGTYDHLALVEKPRYGESIILTPDEFKDYNEGKFAELEKLKNENDIKLKPKTEITQMKLNIFKKKKVQNSEEINFDELAVTLPKSGVEIELTELVKNADDAEMKKDEKEYAPEHAIVKIGNSEMSVAEVVEKLSNMSEEDEEKKKKENEKKEEEKKKKANEEEEEKKKKELENSEDEEDEEDDMSNEEDDAYENEEDEDEDDKKKNHFDKVANADKTYNGNTSLSVVETSSDKIARGKQNY